MRSGGKSFLRMKSRPKRRKKDNAETLRTRRSAEKEELAQHAARLQGN
jgi:hypothetical protein